jgi:hypothetical protein
MTGGELAEQRDPKVGLCSICNHASTLVGAKGITFWRCDQSDTDSSVRRYPTLPVGHCAHFESRPPKSGMHPAE